MRKSFIGVVVLAVLVSAGCVSISEQECLAGDWESIGYRDGAEGHDRTRVLKHADACGKFDVVPDRQAYLAGWEAGLHVYCTPRKGYELGERGRTLNEVCRNPEFSTAYYEGRALFEAKKELRQLRASVDELEDELVEIEQAVGQVKTAQVAEDIGAEERVRLVAELESLVEARVLLEQELADMAAKAFASEARLEELERFKPAY